MSHLGFGSGAIGRSLTAFLGFLDRGPSRPSTAFGYGLVNPRRIYVLPTRQGWTFMALLIVMFVGSINYSNNLGYFLTFLLASMGLSSLVHAHRNMVGLKVRAGGAEPVFAGEPARFRLLAKPTTPRSRFAVQMEALGQITPPQTVQPGADSEFHIVSTDTVRGQLQLGRVAISSRYPLGLARAWAWFELDSSCSIYPAPGGVRPLPDDTGVSGAEGVKGLDAQDDYAGLRDYRPGDPLRRIAWKATARSSAIYSKLFESEASLGLLLRWQDAGNVGDEQRLSQLCLWVLNCHKSGREYELSLPGTRLPPGRGDAHRARCLQALARYGHDTDG